MGARRGGRREVPDDRGGAAGAAGVSPPRQSGRRGNDERVELTVPVEEAKAQALDEEPPDEPIYGDSEKIHEREMETANVPEPERSAEC